MTVLAVNFFKTLLPLHLGILNPNNNKLTMCNHQADSPLHGGLMSDLVTSKYKKVWSHMTLNVPTETRCH